MSRTTLSLVAVPFLMLLGGCPPLDETSPVTAVITLSASKGPAPLTVTASGLGSSSTAATVASYAWNFGGLAAATGSSATYTFENPGRYNVSLTVTDKAGNQATDIVEVRVAGSDDVEALIQTDRDSGSTPLAVAFDGTASNAADDTIMDYYWDFGDGSTSREPAPTHVYQMTGTFTVTLRVVTGGGVEASTTHEIRVTDSPDYSLEFAGNQAVTLPYNVDDTLTSFTLELYIKAEDQGGHLAIFGDSELSIQVRPESNRVFVVKGDNTVEATIPTIARIWTYFAVSYDGATETATVYINGAPVGSGQLEGDIAAEVLLIGQGYTGKVFRPMLWSEARSAAQIAADATTDPSIFDETLLGFWRLQVNLQRVSNRTFDQPNGYLGLTNSEDAADPTYSTDTPSL